MLDKILEVPKNLFTPKCTMAICWLFLHLIPSTFRTLMTCHQILVEKIRFSGLFQSVKWSQLTNKKRPVQKKHVWCIDRNSSNTRKNIKNSCIIL